MQAKLENLPPILSNKNFGAPSVFTADSLLREARRQKSLPDASVPQICVLDPDGDIVRRLRSEGRAVKDPAWACYHTELYRFASAEIECGIIGCAVGAAFAVLIAEQLMASGCRMIISVTSAGQIVPVAQPPYFIMIERALRDEGTSYHYVPPAQFAAADSALVAMLDGVFDDFAVPVILGPTWTTDAPFRETDDAIGCMRAQDLLAVEMEAAALYAFAQARKVPVLCFAHVTNQMGRIHGDFEKGEADGTTDALRVLDVVIQHTRTYWDGVSEKGQDTGARSKSP